MTQTTEANGAATLPAHTLYLPGRTVEVEYTNNDGDTLLERGIVVDTDLDGTVTAWFASSTGFDTVAPGRVRPVTPDRAPIAYDELLVGALGEQLAQRAGADALGRFHRGHNDGRIAFTEAAREMARQVDVRALAAKHQRCGFTYVADPDGAQRTNPTDYIDGDVLVECSFFVDGPGSPYCGVHRPQVEADGRPSIFHAGTTEAERELSRREGRLISRAPIAGHRAAPGDLPPNVGVEPVLTEVELRQIELDGLVDRIEAVLLVHQGANREADPDKPTHTVAETHPMGARELRAAVDQLVDGPLLGAWWDALAYGVRKGRITMHQGPAYSLVSTHQARERVAAAAAVAK